MTCPELKRLLGFAMRGELDPFLIDHGVVGRYGPSDLARDRADLQRLGLLLRVRLVVADMGPLHYLVQTGAKSKGDDIPSPLVG